MSGSFRGRSKYKTPESWTDAAIGDLWYDEGMTEFLDPPERGGHVWQCVGIGPPPDYKRKWRRRAAYRIKYDDDKEPTLPVVIVDQKESDEYFDDRYYPPKPIYYPPKGPQPPNDTPQQHRRPSNATTGTQSILPSGDPPYDYAKTVDKSNLKGSGVNWFVTTSATDASYLPLTDGITSTFTATYLQALAIQETSGWFNPSTRVFKVYNTATSQFEELKHDNVNIRSGGKIVFGNASEQTVAFNPANVVTLTNTTQAVNTVSGALVVGGGVGVRKDVYIGGTLNFLDGTSQSTGYPGIPGPYGSDAAAETAGVGVNKPYFKPDGSVVVRLT